MKVAAPDGSRTEFSYDANGIRTQKRQYKADGTMEYYVDYIWQDGLLTQQTLYFYFKITIEGNTRTERIPISSKFIYDESSQPVGCVTNGEMSYAFVRNLQGDIIAIVDQDGETLVEYSYDPWGKVTSTRNGENLTQLESSVIAVMCPFAYRGYNYDFTTGLYYLQSRYYNPEWGRFLNCDDTNILLATKGETIGANLFAYCNNNPVNRVDIKGESPTPLNATLAFVYGLYMFAFLTYELDQRNLSWLWDYDFILAPQINIESSIISANFGFIVNDGFFYKKSYWVTVSVGLVHDWREYYCNLGTYLNSVSGSPLESALGSIASNFLPEIISPMFSMIDTGTSLVNDIFQEEMNQIGFVLAKEYPLDNELMGNVSYIIEYEQSYSLQTGIVSNIYFFNSVDTYILTPKFERYPF